VGLAVEYEQISGDIPEFVATGTIEFSTKKLEKIKGEDSRSSEASSYPSLNFQRGYPRPRYSYRGMNKRGRGAGFNTYKRPRSQESTNVLHDKFGGKFRGAEKDHANPHPWSRSRKSQGYKDGARDPQSSHCVTDGSKSIRN